MGKGLHFIICLILLGFVLMSPAIPAQAGDDDLNSSVYLVFDPETGEFVTVEDQGGKKRKHEALGITDTASDNSPASAQPDAQASSPAAAAVIAIILIGAAIILAQRKKRQSS